MMIRRVWLPTRRPSKSVKAAFSCVRGCSRQIASVSFSFFYYILSHTWISNWTGQQGI